MCCVAGSGLAGSSQRKVCFSADAAEVEAARGEDVILVRMETSPEDIHGMYAPRDFDIARRHDQPCRCCGTGLGRPCVSGAGEMRIDYDAQIARIGAMNCARVMSSP